MRCVARSMRTLLTIGATAVITSTVAAQQSPPPVGKIAFVNARLVLQSMPGYAQAESTFAAELAAGRAEVEKLQAQFDSAAADFQQQSVMLTPSNRTAKEKELQATSERFQQRNTEIQQRLGLREQELLSPMQERLSAIIDGLRAENNYSMVIDLSAQGLGIITYDKSLDITQRVVLRVNQSQN